MGIEFFHEFHRQLSQLLMLCFIDSAMLKLE